MLFKVILKTQGDSLVWNVNNFTIWMKQLLSFGTRAVVVRVRYLGTWRSYEMQLRNNLQKCVKIF